MESREEIEEYIKSHKDRISEELFDVLYWILLMSHDLRVDLAEAFRKKMKKNEDKNPTDKVKGFHNKSTEE